GGSTTREVKQPIPAAFLNAQAAQLRLTREPPDVEGARRAVDRLVRDGIRAAEIIDRTRALVRKEPPRKNRLHINDSILEVIRLTRGETVKNGINVQTQLAENLPVVE